MEFNRGINLGGFLSQCVHTEEHYKTFITTADIEAIAKMGFDHIRVPVDYNFFETDEGQFVEDHFEMLDKIFICARDCKLNVILDLHKAFGYDFNNAGDAEKNNLFTSEPLQERFLRLWDKIASTYGKYDFVAFELLNEVVEEDNATLWNELIKRAVATIRKQAKDSLIIYGGIQWNSAKTVKLLEKPEDPNIMFTFHFYEPLLFTHQKAYWVPAMDKNETIYYPESMEYYSEKSKKLGFQGEVVTVAKSEKMGVPFFEELIIDAIEAATKAGVGLYCGEFGVIDQAPVEDTLRWFTDIDTAFRKHNIGCSVWSYKLMDFGLTDEHYAPIYKDLMKLWNGQ